MNVWCGVLGNRLIGRFVFNYNLTGTTFGASMRNELPGLLEDIPLTLLSQMYFQDDGAAQHYTRHVKEYLNEHFPRPWWDRCIGNKVAIFTPLFNSLWGHMKTSVYETNFESRAALHDHNFAAAEQIRNRPDNVASATQSLLMRDENCLAN